MAQRRILHVIQSSHLGGTEHAALSTMRELRPAGAIFHVVSPRPRGLAWPEMVEIDDSAVAYPCRENGVLGKFEPREYRKLRAHLVESAGKYDAIWISGSSVTSLLATRGLPRPRLLSHHFHHGTGLAAWALWKSFYECLCRDVEAITYPTEFTRSEACGIVPWLRSRTHVVRLGYRIGFSSEEDRRERQQRARRLLGLPENALIIGNGGWFVRRKRFDVFLETAARIHSRLPEACFVLCGGGPLERELKALAERLGIAPKVRFPGWVSDMRPHYRAWDVVVFNSDFDTLPRAPMEASSHGCVVVASLLYGGLGEFIEHGRNGYLIDRHDCDELARLVLELVTDRDKAAAFRRNAACDLAERFSPEQEVAFYRAFFGL